MSSDPIQKKICVIKAGSAVLTERDGMVDYNSIRNICRQIAYLHTRGWQPVVVSSGAVAAGRGVWLTHPLRQEGEATLLSKRCHASLGQARLLAFYTSMIEEHSLQLRVGQVLVTRGAFSQRERYTAFRETLLEMVSADIVPVINNNDVLSVETLDFSDNDQLAAYVAGLLDADILMLLSDIDGVYNRSPKLYPDAQRIARLSPEVDTWPQIEIDDTLVSKGGMRSKLSALKLMASLGIACCIANGRHPNVLRKILVENNPDNIGTYLEPREAVRLDNYKRWLAAGAAAVGTLIVSNIGADAVTRRERRASLLSAGVERVYGNFTQDTIVALRDVNFQLLGLGRTRYSGEELRNEVKGQSDLIVIHADYLLPAADALFGNTEGPTIEASIRRLKRLGYRIAETKEQITLSRKTPGQKESVELLNVTGNDARALFHRARDARKQFNLQAADWMLFDLIHTADPAAVAPEE